MFIISQDQKRVWNVEKAACIALDRGEIALQYNLEGGHVKESIARYKTDERTQEVFVDLLKKMFPQRTDVKGAVIYYLPEE